MSNETIYRKLQKKVYEILYPDGVSVEFKYEKLGESLSFQDLLRALKLIYDEVAFIKADEFTSLTVSRSHESIRGNVEFSGTAYIDLEKAMDDQAPCVTARLYNLLTENT